MTMRTWMTVLSAAGLLALGSACVVTETSGSGGSGGAGQGGMSSSSSSSGSTGTAGGGGATVTCDANTCADALNVEKPAKDVLICAADPSKPTASEQAHIEALKAVFNCICEVKAMGGTCGDVCAVPGKDANDMDTENTCAGKAPSKDCTTCIGDPMAGCQALIDACIAVK